IKHGYSNCGACHSDPSGGELLTVYGRAMSEAFLSSKWGGGEDEAEESEEEARRERRRIRRAIAQAAGAKFARAKKESKKDEEEESSEEEESDEEESSDEESSEEASADEEEEAESDEEESAPARPFSDPFFGLFGLPDSLLLGGSVRLASTYKPDAEAEPFRFFPMQIDLYGEWRLSSAFRFGGSFGLISVRPGSPHGRAAQIT